MSDSFPLHNDLRLETSKPFVAYTTDNKQVIIQGERLVNAYGDLIYYEEVLVNANPTEEEIFKVNLANPTDGRQIAWGFTSESVTGDTAGGARLRPKDN